MSHWIIGYGIAEALKGQHGRRAPIGVTVGTTQGKDETLRYQGCEVFPIAAKERRSIGDWEASAALGDIGCGELPRGVSITFQGGVMDTRSMNGLLAEAQELLAIFAASQRTAKMSNGATSK